MKIQIAFALMVLLSACHSIQKETSPENNTHSFFVGTYTDGASMGIYTYSLQDNGTLKRIGLAAESENPSFLARSADRQFLLAVNETDREGTGMVESFRIAGDSLVWISRSPSGGAHPCFITVNETGFVLTANYTGGNVGLLRLNKKGQLSSLLDIEQHYGRGTTDRQEAPHAHSAWFIPRSDTVISVDLGTNELWFSLLDQRAQKLLPADPQKLPMPAGAGPRHLAFHPNGRWIYVVNELDCTVSQLNKNGHGLFELGSSVSTLPDGYSDPNTCADIHISSDGTFLYASNRGHNSIAIYGINANDGSLNLAGHEPSRGDGPRNFSLSPDENYVVVANQNTNTLVSFKRDKSSGLLTYAGQVDAPSPVCVLF